MIIYTITNVKNGKKYVGQTTRSLDDRIAAHKIAAKTKNFPLYAAFKKYSLSSFIVEQIDMANTIEDLHDKEIFWISQLKTTVPNGYNIHPGGKGGSLPDTISEDGKRRIGDAARKRMTGRIVSKETKEKLREAHTGVQFTEERKANISRAKKGKLSSLKGRPGKIPSEETRCKMSKAHIGKYTGWNVKNIGQKRSEETCQKISLSLKGKPSPLRGRTWSEERKEKQRMAITKWHQRKIL
jgi:NUMOD3 motif/GIY-YIG catalytic domain